MRKASRLNQTDFRNAIGVKQTTISGYDIGGRNPLDSVILSICREFSVNEDWLRTGEGEMFVPSESTHNRYNKSTFDLIPKIQ